MGRSSSHSGFTLLELIAALAIASILAAIAIPNWSVLLPTYRLNSSARQVQSELHNIKSLAISKNRSFQFNVASDSAKEYQLQEANTTFVTKPLPEQIEITRKVTVGFSSRGTGDSGRVRLKNSQGSCVQLVVSGTGRIRMCKVGSCDVEC